MELLALIAFGAFVLVILKFQDGKSAKLEIYKEQNRRLAEQHPDLVICAEDGCKCYSPDNQGALGEYYVKFKTADNRDAIRFFSSMRKRDDFVQCLSEEGVDAKLSVRKGGARDIPT
jgi:hypothetical protein